MHGWHVNCAYPCRRWQKCPLLLFHWTLDTGGSILAVKFYLLTVTAFQRIYENNSISCIICLRVADYCFLSKPAVILRSHLAYFNRLWILSRGIRDICRHACRSYIRTVVFETLYTIDEEGDMISFSGDEELVEALGYVNDGVFHVYVELDPRNHSTTTQPDPHHGVCLLQTHYIIIGLLCLFRPQRMHEMRAVATDVPVAWCVCLSHACAV